MDRPGGGARLGVGLGEDGNVLASHEMSLQLGVLVFEAVIHRLIAMIAMLRSGGSRGGRVRGQPA